MMEVWPAARFGVHKAPILDKCPFCRKYGSVFCRHAELPLCVEANVSGFCPMVEQARS